MELDKNQVLSNFFSGNQDYENDFDDSEFFNSEVLAQCDMLEKNYNSENAFTSEDDAALCEITSVIEHQIT